MNGAATAADSSVLSVMYSNIANADGLCIGPGPVCEAGFGLVGPALFEGGAGQDTSEREVNNDCASQRGVGVGRSVAADARRNRFSSIALTLNFLGFSA